MTQSHTLRIAGVEPRAVVTPHDRDEFAATVRELHASRKSFAFVGGGTELELGNAPTSLDTVVRTVALDRLVDYAPEDQTITVEAGMTLAELDRILAQNAQMVPLDVVDRERATVGGVVATNAYGRRRQRYGTVKDAIVGVGIVRPDGTPARGGGKVVKNVAGFDLPKLMVGSLGTLGAIVTVTLRVHPVPQTVRAAVLHLETADQVTRALREVVARRLEPESLALYNYGALVATFAGTRGGVDAQLATVLGEVAAAAQADGAELTALERESYEQRERAVRRDGAWRVRIVAPPAYPVATLGAFVAEPPVAVPVAYPLLGVALHAYGEADEPQPGEHLEDLRAHVAAQTGGRGAVIVHAMPAAARGRCDAWSSAPVAELSLMRTLKQNFDPLGLANPGRFIGGL